MKFSVITISYNHAEFIEKTIQSVLDQQYHDFEHIIVDGGSTDGSIEIFKKYPHLRWISEPDRGVSHALNKGFRLATGDVIAWINSDDFYASNAFTAVAAAIKNMPVVLGDSYQTDRKGNPEQLVTNIPRSREELQKYWIPKAWLSQPAVFFSRAALESVKLPNGDYIDETFKYSMDFDLWLRLSEKYPLTNYIPQTLSYFRVYGENLTGRAFASPQRELGRAFRKSYARLFPAERPQEIILPVQTVGPDLGNTLQAIVSQTLQDFQITIVDGSTDKESSKVLKETLQAIEEATTLLTVRHIRMAGASQPELVDRGLSEAVGGVVSVIRPGDVPDKDFTTQVLNIFAHDVHGGAIYLKETDPLYQNLKSTSSGLVEANTLLDFSFELIPFSVRRGVVQEVGGYLIDEKNLSFPAFILKIMSKGWLTPVESTGLSLAPLTAWHQAKEIYSSYVKAYLFSHVGNSVKKDLFYPIRVQSGYSPHFAPDAILSVTNFLQSMPAGWSTMATEKNPAELMELCERYPDFSIGWYLLRKQTLASGDFTNAERAQAQLKRLGL